MQIMNLKQLFGQAPFPNGKTYCNMQKALRFGTHKYAKTRLIGTKSANSKQMSVCQCNNSQKPLALSLPLYQFMQG